MAGYSSSPPIKKLGITQTTTIYLVNAPKDYFALLGSDLTHQFSTDIKTAAFFHVFAEKRADLERYFADIIAVAKPDAVIWISWYKKSSKMATNVNEDVIREIVLPTGWVDVKVCAVSDIWSGLKIVKRLKNR